jgi:hypothetical protein
MPILFAYFLVFSCAKPDPQDTPPASDTATPTNASTTTDTGGGRTTTPSTSVDTADSGTPPQDTGTAPAGPPGVEGVLVDPVGAPLPSTRVLCCAGTTCYATTSDASGFFFFDLDPGTQAALKTQEVEDPPRAAALHPILVGDVRQDVGEVYVPDLPPTQLFGPTDQDPQTLAAGDGLELTLSVGALTPEWGPVFDGVAARLLPPDRVPPYPALQGRVPLGVWAIHPFGTASASPIGVRVTSSLPAGSPVEFWEINHLDGTLTGPYLGHADGTHASTDPGQGPLHLTYLVLVTP